MKPVTAQLESLLERCRIYAALHDNFNPGEAVAWANEGPMPDDTQTVARLFSMLRRECTRLRTEPSEPPCWTMRPATRRTILTDLTPADLAQFTCDTPICDALIGKGPYAPDKLDQLLISAGDPGLLTEIVGTLDRAGPNARGHDRLAALRGLLNRLRAEKRTDAILGDGFIGREDELNWLGDWITNARQTPPLRAKYISGIDGIGKSFLLEQAIQNARHLHAPIFVRLDFERSGLDVLNRESFFDEISRQVGDGLPEAAQVLRALRLRTAEKDAPQISGQSPLPQTRLIDTLAKEVRASGRPLLIILDTLEVLRSAGETRIEALFENLDLLAHTGINRIAIIAAGRGNALEPAPKRVAGRVIRLSGLSKTASQAFLQSRAVPKGHWPAIMTLARGNPLFLELAARAVADNVFDASRLPEDFSDAAVGAYLYRAILSSLPDPLRKLASDGLLLYRLSAETLEHVVAPVVAPDLTAQEQATALEMLRAQTWLVTSDPRTGGVRHRNDLRRAFLPLIYAADPDTAAVINSRAVDWYASRDRFEALYHALQLVRAGRDVPEVPSDLALRFDEFMLEELPDHARDAVRHAQGRRSDFGRAGSAIPAAAASIPADSPEKNGWLRFDPDTGRVTETSDSSTQPDQRAIDDLEILLKKADLREAAFVLTHAIKGAFPADGPLARLILCHFWLTGRWTSARKLLDRQPGDALETAVRDTPLLQGRVMLEMQAEFHFDALVTHLRDPKLLRSALKAHADSRRIGMEGAALDFALICALGDTPPPPHLHMALGILAHNGIDNWPAAERLSRLARTRRSKAAIRGAPGQDRQGGPDANAQELALLNPYAKPIGAFLSASLPDRLARFVAGATPLPGAAVPHYALGMAGIPLPDRYFDANDLANTLNGLGLTAEWAMGFATFNPVADFPGLAHAAERWRKLLCGDWTLGRTRPDEWEGSGAPDRMTRARAARMMAAPDPVATAARQLLFWSEPTHSAPEAAAHLSKRFANRCARIAQSLAGAPSEAGRLIPALRALIAADVPALIAAPLAVLIAHNVALDQAFPQDLQ